MSSGSNPAAFLKIKQMFVSLFLLYFIAFFIWYNTSKKAKWKDKPTYLQQLENRPLESKILSTLLILTASAGLVYTLGWGSGIAASFFYLMAIGSMVVCFFPFRYFTLKSIVMLYLTFLVLEIIL